MTDRDTETMAAIAELLAHGYDDASDDHNWMMAQSIYDAVNAGPTIRLHKGEYEEVRRDMAAAIHALWDEEEPVPPTYDSEDAARDCADVAFDALLDFDYLRGRDV